MQGAQLRGGALVLEDKEWAKWSDREIARRAGVHHDTVGRLRAEFTGGIRQSNIRKAADGRIINTANIGSSKPKHPVLPDYKPPAPPARKVNLETGEGLIDPDPTSELFEIASQPVPESTPYTEMQEALKRNKYDEAEKIGKHIMALLEFRDGELLEIVNGPSGKLLGLPRLYKILLKEMRREPGPPTITVK